MPFTETDFERAIIELLQNELGYAWLYGPDIQRDYRSPIYEDSLPNALSKINPSVSQEAIKETIHKLKNISEINLIQRNRIFMDYLQNGVEVYTMEGNDQKYHQIRLIDYTNIDSNEFYVINQWTVTENGNKRPDIVIFINGLPLVVVELKSCSRENTDVSAAYRQLRNYMQDIPSLFTYNAFCVMSDLAVSKAGTITSGEDRFMEWKTKDGSEEERRSASFETLFTGMFEKRRLLDIIRNFILFSEQTKILAGYHQYYAVKKAIDRTKIAVSSNGKGGIFWHTQGSGKSLSMVFYSKLLQEHLESPTIVVITDRNDLDDQLYGQFAKCKDYLRQTPKQADSRADLKKQLNGIIANGIIFTTMQKFEESAEPLSERRNIILIADEAHRSQYSLDEKIDAKTGRISLGLARLVRDSLPNGTFIGFTGTPISLKDRSTREVFGDYIDVYDMTQSVEDGATRPVYYESRVINLGLNEEVLRKIDAEYIQISENAEVYMVEKSKKELSKIDAILGADITVQSLCADIIKHYEDRQDLLTGKAMIVAYSRPAAMKIYKEILRIRPSWNEKVKVVMTGDNNDPEDWKPIVKDKTYRAEMATKFKNNDDEMKIAIVVDMWLTGFDIPSLATMYFYKPMEGHNLMQAIARVNRVFRDKEGGLIVDYVGIASALKQAMADYTVRDQTKYGDTDIAKTALPKFIEKLGVCADLFHGFDYSKFETGSDLDRSRLIVDGINFIIGNEDNKPLFIKEATYMRQYASLCRSLQTKSQRFEAAFFEAVRTVVTRITTGEKPSLAEINMRIGELLKQSIRSEGVINLFENIKTEFSLFDGKFLSDIAAMQQKNLAAELLRRLISDQIIVFRKTNVVQSELFSERMQKLMNRYRNGQLTNIQVIEELMKMAEEIARNREAGQSLGLNIEEMAFYDALTRPVAIKDFYANDTLVQMTKELTETLAKSRTIDWQKKESARATMRVLVKRLLKKYKYPPEGQEEAMKIVIEQCEMWTDNEDILL